LSLSSIMPPRPASSPSANPTSCPASASTVLPISPTSQYKGFALKIIWRFRQYLYTRNTIKKQSKKPDTVFGFFWLSANDLWAYREQIF
jgi:hypothetical protein